MAETPKDNPPDFSGLIDDARAYLDWQRRLGHPGLSWERLRQRTQEEARSAAGVAPPKPPAAASPPRPVPAPAESHAAPQVQQAALFGSAPKERPTLEAIRAEIGDCTRCKLCQGRKTIVFGEGNPSADIMFVGEGPGADEDEQGRPFVGRAGQLLTKWIELGMGIPREQVYIANIVKCRPPNNRDPERDEVESCIGFVKQQIRAVNPKALVLLGRVPMRHLLGITDGITKVHGIWHDFEGVPTIALFHPSYCLRPPQDEKRKIVWEDLKKILRRLNLPIPQKGGK
ncbi:MAG: uracil-DNA glycosylase [Myxococcales bacterium]|nr:MAG: uracil-DNA glycosylase [Myxococcales bacterium]